MIKSPIPTPSTYVSRADTTFPGMVVMFECERLHCEMCRCVVVAEGSQLLCREWDR